MGGKACVMGHIYDEVFERPVLEFIAPADFKIRFGNMKVGVFKSTSRTALPSDVGAGKFWLEHKQRREYSSIVFNPKKPKEYAPDPERPDAKVYNLWEGLSCEPKKGSWKRMKKHIWDVMCNRDHKKFKYVMKWFAWTFQNLETRAEVALVFKGKQGAGKGVLLSQFKHIFGQHYLTIASSDHFTGKFNHHLRKVVFLFADEAYDPKDRESEGKMKQLITEPCFPVEAKFHDATLAANRLHIVMATNNERIIVAAEDTRRFFVNQVDNRYAKGQGCTSQQRINYFKPIWDEMDNGGREAMTWDFINYDLRNWHPRDDIPETEELKAQRRLQYVPQNAVSDWLELGEFPGKLLSSGVYQVKASLLEQHMREKIPMLKDPRIITWRKLQEMFERMGLSKKHGTVKRNGDGMVYLFKELHLSRADWDAANPAYTGDWSGSHEGAEVDYYREAKWAVQKDYF